MNISHRLARLERTRPIPPSDADRAAASERIMAKIDLISTRFEDDEAGMPLEERLRLSPAAHFAWSQRFGPTPLIEILRLHGLGGQYGLI